jgi:hypothetical protein
VTGHVAHTVISRGHLNRAAKAALYQCRPPVQSEYLVMSAQNDRVRNMNCKDSLASFRLNCQITASSAAVSCVFVLEQVRGPPEPVNNDRDDSRAFGGRDCENMYISSDHPRPGTLGEKLRYEKHHFRRKLVQATFISDMYSPTPGLSHLTNQPSVRTSR